MKSFEEFVKEFTQAGPDPERYNKVLTERSQEFVDEIRKCTGNIAQGDIPFAIIALTAAKAALEKITVYCRSGGSITGICQYCNSQTVGECKSVRKY